MASGLEERTPCLHHDLPKHASNSSRGGAMNKIQRLLLAVALVLTSICVFLYGNLANQRTSSFTLVFNSQQKWSDINEYGNVVITQPVHNFPSFDVSDVRGRRISYGQIQCGEELFKPGHKIPSLIHYVWFGIFQISKIQYYAIRSAALVQKPKLIVFHMDHQEPVGRYWEKLKREVPCMRIEYFKAPDSVMGRKITRVEHKSDVARLAILAKYGGIYSDVNVFFVRSLDPLMINSVVLGKEEDRSYGNSLILAERNATFIQLWRKSYINFDHTHWSDHSTIMPMRMHKWFPSIPLHVEQYSMMRPNYLDGTDWLIENNWDLRYNYCAHLYVNDPNAKKGLEPVLDLSESDLITLDNTFGQLVRISLFGTPYFKMDDMDEKLLKAHSPVPCYGKVTDDGIPNIVHFVWNGERIQYRHYLGVRAAISMLKPSTVYFHLLKDADPFYQPYLMITREISCLKLVNQTYLATRLLHSKVSGDHRKLLLSLHILHDFGGVLIDFNTTILQSPPRKLFADHFVIGKNRNRFDGSFIMAIKGSRILQNWIRSIETGIEPNDSLSNVLESATEQFSSDEQMISAPEVDWFQETHADLPSTLAMSFRNSGWDSDTDMNEKQLMQGRTMLGILARTILFN